MCPDEAFAGTHATGAGSAPHPIWLFPSAGPEDEWHSHAARSVSQVESAVNQSAGFEGGQPRVRHWLQPDP